jgi:predicted oxidoreductase
MQEQTAEKLKEMREQLDMVTKCLTANSPQSSPQPSYAGHRPHPILEPTKQDTDPFAVDAHDTVLVQRYVMLHYRHVESR